MGSVGCLVCMGSGVDGLGMLECATCDSYSYSKLYYIRYLPLVFTFCFPSLVPVGRLRDILFCIHVTVLIRVLVDPV